MKMYLCCKYLVDFAIANAHIILQYIPSERTAMSFLKVRTKLSAIKTVTSLIAFFFQSLNFIIK